MGGGLARGAEHEREGASNRRPLDEREKGGKGHRSSVRPFVVCPFVRLSDCLFVRLSVCPFARSFVRSFVRPFFARAAHLVEKSLGH